MNNPTNQDQATATSAGPMGPCPWWCTNRTEAHLEDFDLADNNDPNVVFRLHRHYFGYMACGVAQEERHWGGACLPPCPPRKSEICPEWALAHCVRPVLTPWRPGPRSAGPARR
jgi:hypothetical protein